MSAGRPSQKKNISPAMFEALASLCLTDAQIAKVFDVTEMTICRWKKDEAIMLALKKGKEIADARVERTLFERAIGYTHPEEVIMQYQGNIIKTETLKHYPPDVLACIFWLKNRKPAEWRDRVDGNSQIINNSTHYHFIKLNDKELIDKVRAEKIDLPLGIESRIG